MKSRKSIADTCAHMHNVRSMVHRNVRVYKYIFLALMPPPPTIGGKRHYVGRSSVRCPAVNVYFA